MAWNPKGGPWGSGGGGGGGGGPWGRGPSSGGPTPNIEDVIRRGQERVKRLMPGGIGSGRGIAVVLLAAVGLWLATGFYRVEPGEQGVELLFGKYVKTTTPGLNYWFPSPVGEVMTPNVEQTNQITIGFRGAGEGGRTGARDVLPESLMLTSDQNIIDVDFIVQWRIKNAGDFLFSMRDPEGTVKVAAESAIREVMGQTPLEDALTIRRQEVDNRTRDLLQRILDGYNAGVLVVEVKQLKVDPPAEVIDAFNDVQRARQDQDRSVNEANAYRNDIVPRARGAAERLLQEANAFKEKAVLDAQGEAKRFLSVLGAYQSGPEITERRLYLERMQNVFDGTQKVIIDSGKTGGGTGVIPYLPLPELQRAQQRKEPGQ